MFEVTETRTAMFTADEERRYRALCLAVSATNEAKTEWAVDDTIDWPKMFENYLRGKEEKPDA